VQIVSVSLHFIHIWQKKSGAARNECLTRCTLQFSGTTFN
jgi:hypothetical protein